MRIMLELTDNASPIASAYARARALKLGETVSELIQRGSGAEISPTLRMKQRDSVWMFDVPADAPRVTATRVAHLLSC